MIKYNTKEWFALIFKFHRSDTFRILLKSMILIAIYSGIIAYIEIEILKIHAKEATVLHTLLGFVLSLLLVFRTNTAYERWWEGRRAWGELINNSRNLTLKIKSFSNIPVAEKTKLAGLIINYVFALKDHLRGESNSARLDEVEGLDLKIAAEKKHLPNYIAFKIYEVLNQLLEDGYITGEQLIILNTEAKAFTDICGVCERIKSTPIPYSYSLFLKKFIFVYIMTLPIGFVAVFGMYIILVVTFIFYVLTSLELIAEEIEDPFGKDSNDLPTEEIALRIKMNVKEIVNY
jgi:ion channel-forming bestrophin family protein